MIFVTYDRTAMVEVNGRLGFVQPDGVTDFEIRRVARHVEDAVDFGVVLTDDADFTTWNTANPDLATVIADVDAYFTEGWQGLWNSCAWGAIMNERQWDGVPETFDHPHAQYQYMVDRLRGDFYLAADAKTRQLIAQGFEYPTASSQMFSLSAEAQMKWTAMYVTRTLLTYPVLVVTADEQATVELADAAAAEAMYTSMVETVRTHIDGGRALKNTLRDASLADEYAIIAASVDNR